MELHESHEGYGVETYTSNLVAEQAQYSLPEHTGRISRVLIVSVDGDSETPLARMERWGEVLQNTTTAGGDGYLPSYRIVGNSIVLEPYPPEARTGGLKIEIEAAAPRTANDADKLPDDYPPFIESLLVYDTVILALDHQGSQSPLPQGVYSSYLRQKMIYEDLWTNYIETRSFGKVFGTRFSQGA